MTAVDQAQKGQLEAGTQRAGNSSAEVVTAEKALQDLLGVIAPQSTLPGLLDERADDLDLLGRAAEKVNAQRRERGRPNGSHNRRNDEMFDYLEARGFKMPEIRMMEIISADPLQLAYALQGHTYGPIAVGPEMLLEIIRMQLKAAEAMLPYKFAKKQELKIEHNRRELHVMVAGTLGNMGQNGLAKAFDLTNGAPIEIAGNSGTEAQPVGQPPVGQDAQVHDAAKETGKGTAD
jgi:hypothetical protein